MQSAASINPRHTLRPSHTRHTHLTLCRGVSKVTRVRGDDTLTQGGWGGKCHFWRCVCVSLSVCVCVCVCTKCSCWGFLDKHAWPLCPGSVKVVFYLLPGVYWSCLAPRWRESRVHTALYPPPYTHTHTHTHHERLRPDMYPPKGSLEDGVAGGDHMDTTSAIWRKLPVDSPLHKELYLIICAYLFFCGREDI